jgi:class 3 adenylate cyclase
VDGTSSVPEPQGDVGWLAGSLRRAYRRLGPRYVPVVMAMVPQLAVVNVVTAVVTLALYADMSAAEFARILATGLAGMFVANAMWRRTARGHLAPLDAWREADRDPSQAVAAWKAGATLPLQMMRRDLLSPSLGGFAYAFLLAWVGYVVWELERPPLTVAPLFVGVVLFVMHVETLRYLALEIAFRPVLEDISRSAGGADPDLFAPGLPLRSRLLVTLPAINVVTGVTAVVVVGLGNLTLADLGLAAVVSAAVAGSASLALTILVSESVTGPIQAMHSATRAIADGDLATRVPVVTTDETGALARSFNRMAAGLEQRERLREALGTFVDPGLAERVLSEGTVMEGQEVELSLLFLDIRGFTAYCETAAASDVVARLNDLYGAVVPVILRHGGHANKFIGDGLLAVFGAPERLPDHADRAVAAAIEIAGLVRQRYGDDLRVGIGVNSGRVVVGTVGGGGRLDFTVIGDAVNTAARVEAATRDTGDDVLITEATLRASTNDRPDWEERQPVPLRGKRDPVRLYAPGQPAAVPGTGSGSASSRSSRRK